MSNPAEGFLGGLLVMGFIACMLYGITILQAFIYSQSYPNDTTLLKCLVIWVFFLDTSHTAFCIVLLYYYLIANFGNVSAWRFLNWSLGAIVLTQVLLSSTVEGIYVRRIWFVSRNARLLTSFLVFIVFSRFCFGLAGTFCVLNFGLWSKFKAQSYTLPIVSLSLSLGAFADLLIAITFSAYLLRGRNQYSRASRTLANMLTLYAINTGAATATTSVVSVIVYGSLRSSFAFLGLSEMGAKLYANSFLGRLTPGGPGDSEHSLNSRAFLRHKNLARGFSGFALTDSDVVDLDLDAVPSDDSESPPPGPGLSVVEFRSGGTVVVGASCGTRTPSEDRSAAV